MDARKPHIVTCSNAGCTEPAVYKVAARWTDGNLVELKPYGFACTEHVEEMLELARKKHGQCRLVEGEHVEPVAVFRLDSGIRDSELARADDRA